MSERRKIDINKFKASAKEQRENNRGNRLFNLPEGVELFSIGSAKDGDDIVKKDINILLYKQTKDPKNESGYDYKRTYYTHNNLGPEGKTSVVCPTTFGGKCPICELHREVTADWNNMSESERKQAGQLRKKERCLYNIIDDKKVKVWDMSAFLFQAALIDELKAADDDSYEAFASDDNGYTIATRFSKQKKGDMQFYEVSKLDFKERKPVPDEYLNATVELDNVLVVKSYNELVELLDGGASVEEEPEVEEDTTPKPSSRRQEAKVEEVAEEVEEEIEEEEEAPRRPRREIVEEDDEEAPW